MSLFHRIQAQVSSAVEQLVNESLKASLPDFCEIDMDVSDYTLATRRGSLCSVLQIEGYRDLISGQQFYHEISQRFAGAVGASLKDGKTHEIQMVFEVDPTQSHRMVENSQRAVYETIQRLSMDVKELIDARVETIAKYCSLETCFLVLWTHNTSSGQERKVEKALRKKASLDNYIPSRNGQDVLYINRALQNAHDALIQGVEDSLNRGNVLTRKLPTHEAIRAVRRSIDEEYTSDVWEPSVPGDRPILKAERSHWDHDEYSVRWPNLYDQCCPRSAEEVNRKMIRIGSKVFVPMFVKVSQKKIEPFMQLLMSSSGRGSQSYPWRIAYNIKGDGKIGFGATMAGIFRKLSADNRGIHMAQKTLESFKDNFQLDIVSLRISICTWGPADDYNQVLENANELKRTVEGWGLCEVSDISGDPTEGFMSTTLAHKDSIAPSLIVPLEAASFIMPLYRPCSAWHQGSVLFISPDRKLMPFQPMSSIQESANTLIFAAPRSGKSVLMNLMSYALCTAPGIERLPRIGIMDIGPSSSGLISLIKESLPLNKRHLAQHYRLSMTADYAINFFDTHLFCRFPTSADQSYIENMIGLIVQDPSADQKEAMSSLIKAVVHEMYFSRSEKGRNAVIYSPVTDPKVHEAVTRISMRIDKFTTWWEVVDALGRAGLMHEAGLAQRHAVPTLADAVSAAREPRIQEAFQINVPGTNESLITYFSRSIGAALGSFPIFSRHTRFDLGEARVVALDLEDVCPDGSDQAKQQSSIMYMLARYVLGKNFKLNKDSVREMPYPSSIEPPPSVPVDLCREYHRKRIAEISEDLKLICADEFHRTSSSPQIRAQFFRDAAEGSKWRMMIVLSSQSLMDFDEDLCSKISNVFILSKLNNQETTRLHELFWKSNDSEVYYLQERIQSPMRGRPGTFCAKLSTKAGRFTQLLRAPISANEYWALTTTAEDRVLRDRLYDLIGPSKARQILALTYPGGVADEKEKRQNQVSKVQGGGSDMGIFDVFEKEILQKAKARGIIH